MYKITLCVALPLFFSHNYHLDGAYNDPRQRQWRGEMENGGVRVRGEREKNSNRALCTWPLTPLLTQHNDF